MSPDRGAQPKTAGLTALPTGEVTFLFSDIEGSTQRWDAHPEAMKTAVIRHEQIVSGAIVRHGGYVFKLVGDAFCAAFHSAPDAIAAAVDAQRALAEEDFSSVNGLRVRMGLHTGNAEERNADYFGPTVNRVARLMSIGHGGQVLLSGALASALRNTPPSDTVLVDLGLRRLKDLTQPEQVWQLTIAGLPDHFPPLNSLDARANNLPIQITNLFGRERDVEDVKMLVGKSRLLTLSGSGGVGKTRLALQVGADLLDRYPDGVWFADLAPISDPHLVASVVAGVVSMPQRGDQRLDETIPQWLKRKQLLLILDNCEHVLAAIARLADAIVRSCPGVRLLATSRQALGIDGEAVHRLPSLAVPAASVDVRSSDALTYGAVALFVDRAKSADIRFSLSDDTAPIVAEICRRLDGIPLAIELAAARVKVLSIPSLAQRLDDRFKILTGGSRTALPRQKTLAALIDWSYDLLTPQEQTMFDRLGIFAGGFSLDAAESVCGGGDMAPDQVLDLLSSLTDKSLVIADTTGDRERYRLLESTRDYALERLSAAEQHEALARRHAEYFRYQAQAVDKRYATGPLAAWLASVELDLDNYRAAMEWALTDGRDPVLGGAVAGALGGLWFDDGLEAEGRYWIGRAQAGLDESAHPLIAARLWRALANISAGERMRDCAQRGFSLYDSLGYSHRAAWCLQTLGFALYQIGRLDEASEATGRALAAMRERGDEPGVASSLNLLGSITFARGEIPEGRALLAQALEAFKALKMESGVAGVLTNLAELEFADGRFAQAVHLIDEVLETRPRLKNAMTLTMAHINSAAYRIALGDFDGARAAAIEGLHCARQSQSALFTAIALQHLALLRASRGDVRSGACLVGYVDVRCKDLKYEREISERRSYEKLMTSLREHLGEAEIEKLAADGARWSEDRAVEEALKA